MSFFEILVILVVGLIVIGPERLPETLRTSIRWITRVKRVMNQTRQEFEQQLGVDEIRREIHNEEILASLKAAEAPQTPLQKHVSAPIEQSIQAQIKQIEDSIDEPVHHTKETDGSQFDDPETRDKDHER